MTYERINFVDQSVERPRTYEMIHNPDGSVTLVDSFGLVDELGTPINADTMNHIEDGIAAGSFTKYSENTNYKAGDLITIFKDDKLKVYKSLKDENINNSVENTDFWEEIELGGGSGAYKTGQVVLFDHILTYKESEGFERLGTYVYKSAIAGSRYGYPTFYEQCLNEYQEAVADGIYFKHENGHVFYDIANKAEVDAVYNSTGIAWAYGIDTANERIFLPRNDYYFKNGSADEVGSTVNQELPNIKGSFNASLMTSGLSQSASGAVTTTEKSNNSKGGTGHTFTEYQININASKSNSTYKDGGEVIPKSVSMIAYMVVGNTANEEALTDIIDITTTENDTLPLFYNTYSQQDMTSTGAFVNASLGNYLDGSVWTTAYAEIEKMGIGAKFGAGTIKAYGDSSITDFDLVLNQSNMTFRLPLKNGDEDLISEKFDVLTLNASGSNYTALANGLFYLNGAPTNTSSITEISMWVKDEALQTSVRGERTVIPSGAATNPTLAISVKKGDVVSVNYSNLTLNKFQFVYAQGNGNLYYKLDNVVQNAQLLDVAGVTSALNKKVSVDNLVETPVIIETYNLNTSSGYIVWSNGYCEQWGSATSPSTANAWGTTVTLYKKYRHSSYFIAFANFGDSTQMAAIKIRASTRTTSSFEFGASVQNTGVIWRTFGQLAEGEY